MAQPYCSYEELVYIIPILTADSTTPVNDDEINPLIEKFLIKCRASIFAIGGHSALLLTPEGIVAKISFKTGDQRLQTEQDAFDVLEKSPSPHIIPCFLSRPEILFMPFIDGRTLDERIALDTTPRPILLWMFQLASATTSLESHGLAHGDIKPGNVLVDSHDKVTLLDLDHTLPIGTALEVGNEPYVRVHPMGEIKEGEGLYGSMGAKTEQFALGSIFWYMTRGEELYGELDGFERVNRLARRELPTLIPGDPVDEVIGHCWLGRFDRMADLLRDIEDLAARQGLSHCVSRTEMMPGAEYLAKRELCEHYYSLLLGGEDTRLLRNSSVGDDKIEEESRPCPAGWLGEIPDDTYFGGLVRPSLTLTVTVGAAMVLTSYLWKRV